jgi:hypothetical protein
MMSARRSKEPSKARLTPGQRKWFQHLRAAERSGETIKDYAARQGMSVQSLYQGGKRLRRLGVLEPRVRRRRKRAASGFVKVEPGAARRETGPAWRVRLSSGVVFESSAPLAHDDLLSLLAALAAPR